MTDEKVVPLKKAGTSKWSWVPFSLVFLLAITVLILSFVPTAITINNIDFGPVKFSEDHATHRYIQLGVLAALLAVALMLPVWVTSMKKEGRSHNAPLGLPRGSVRGIIALVAISFYVVLAIKNNRFDAAQNVLLLVLAFYFGTRVAEAHLAQPEQKTEQKQTKE